MKEAELQPRTIASALLLALLLPLDATAAGAARISVIKPASEQTIHSNQGKLTVKLRRARGVPGSTVRLVLDGAPLPQAYRSDTIALQGIDRGAHTLRAVLFDASGQRIAASAPVSFYMWHASRLLPNRK
ncbi:MAG: hypothetical protein WCA01_04755 [Burkholderiales bacterium]